MAIDPFIERFVDEVDDCLGDPHSQKRLTRAKRLELLYQVQVKLFERLLSGSTGQESNLGRVERAITLVNGQTFYPLPPRFRQFLELVQRDPNDRDVIRQQLVSIPQWSPEVGVEILSAQNGFRVQPKVDSVFAGNWTLICRQGPAMLFYSTVDGINVDGDEVVVDAPAATNGELITIEDYYAGSVLNIYAGLTGVPVAREISASSYSAVDEQITFTLRDALADVPTGDVDNPLMAEISPEFPIGYDSIYAYEVAIAAATKRGQFTLRNGLKDDRKELWMSIEQFYSQNVADRQPVRMIPERPEVDPYA